MTPLSTGLAVAAAYQAASRANDGAALVALSAPDAVVWHNYDEVETTMAHTAKALAWMHRNVADLSWVDVHLAATTDGFVWQSIMTGTAAGGTLRVHSCVVVRLDGVGLISRLDEYLDQAATAVLRS